MIPSNEDDRIRQKLDHFLSAEEYDNALKCCKYAVDEGLLTSSEALPYFYRIGLLTSDKRVQKGTIRYYEKLLAALGERGELLSELGTLYFASGDASKAQAVFEKVLESNPRSSDFDLSVRHPLADILTDQGRYAEAETVLKPVLKRIAMRDPNTAPVLGLMGKIQNKLKNGRQSSYWYDMAITLDPNELSWYRERALALEESGDYKKALAYWNRMLGVASMDMSKTVMDNDRPLFKVQEFMKAVEFGKRHKSMCEKKGRGE